MEEFDIKRERRYCSRLGWGLLFVLAWSLVWGVLVYFVDVLYGLPDMLFYLLSLVGPYIISLPVCWFICPRRRTPAPVWHHVSKVRILDWFAGGIFIMFVGNLVGSFIDKLLYRIAGNTPVNLVSESMEQMPLTIIVIGVCVAGPLCEELLFRGLIANRLAIYGEKPAAVVSALLFGMYHANMGQFFYAFGLGILLAYAYFRTGRIIIPLILHMLFNIFGGLLPTVFMVSDISLVFYGLANLCFLIAGGIVLMRSIGGLVWKRGLKPSRFIIVFGNPGMVILIICYFVETAMNYILFV